MRILALLLILLFPAVSFGQHEPVVMVGAENPYCQNGACVYKAGFGNGVIIHADNQQMIVATAGHNIDKGRKVKVWAVGTWHDAAEFRSVFTDSQDFGVIVVTGNFAGVPSMPLYRGNLLQGVALSVDAYWPAEPKWLWRRLSLRRIMHQAFGDTLDRPVTQGVSGAPVVYQNQVAGIVTGINSPTMARSSVTFFTPASTAVTLLDQWGISTRMQAPAEPPKLLIPDDSKKFEDELNALKKELENLKAPAQSAAPKEPAVETPVPVIPVENPDPAENSLKNWGIENLSNWGWAALGGAVAGPVGIAIPVVGRLVQSRLKRRKTEQKQTVEPVRERGIEKVVNLSDQERQRYEQQIQQLTELHSNASKHAGPASCCSELRSVASQCGKEDVANCHAPFPRYLDEADQLRSLRQREGRVAALDALVGMLFDDEVKFVLDTSDSEAERSFVRNLKNRITEKVDQIAPIKTP